MEIVERADRSMYNFVGVSTLSEGLKQMVSDYHLAFLDVITDLEDKDRIDCGIRGTPMTMVVGEKGIVEKIWFGALTGASKSEAELYFGFKLPGLTTDATNN
jgi:hypothetical protein